MQGDIVKAAKWLGGSIVTATLVAVIGFHPMVTGRVLTVTRVAPEYPVQTTAAYAQPQVLPTNYSSSMMPTVPAPSSN